MVTAEPQLTRDATPAKLGYRWPAEWEPHAATWLAWPHNPNTWPGAHPEAVEQFVALVRILAAYEPVHLLAGPDEVWPLAERRLGHVQNVTLHSIPTNDAWCRDYGPIFLTRQQPLQPLAAIDGRFNSWGGKYPPFHHDDQVARAITRQLDCPRFHLECIFEGGAIEGNGRGMVLSTTTCLPNPNRNPTLTTADWDQLFADYLGARKVVWLTGGDLPGDDTDGHIDQLARFVGPRTVLVAVEPDASLPHAAALRGNAEQLAQTTDQDGQPLEVIELPLPRPQFLDDLRLPASYCNFYIANGVVLVPQFGDPADRVAIELLRTFFPDRDVIGVDSSRLVVGLGSFHCLTQQQPALLP